MTEQILQINGDDGPFGPSQREQVIFQYFKSLVDATN
jgi:hypothetical protein